MRIACIATSRVPSRTANSIEVMKVCQALTALGHEVCLWTAGRRPRVSWEELARHYGLRGRFAIEWVDHWPPLKRYDFCWRALAQAHRWDPDLYYIWPVQAAALAAHRGWPTVLELHDQPSGRLGPRWLGQFLHAPGARRLLPISRALEQWVGRHYDRRLAPPFSVVSPSGVDLERYADLPGPSEARRELRLPEMLTAGYTGHFYPGRGLELMTELARRNPDLHFVWAGGEPEAVEHWRRRLEDHGIENVTLLGFVANEALPLVQAACDLLLMPYGRRISVSGGGNTAAFASPMKVFEYMAAGRAILSSDLPVLREVLNEENAVLLPPEDIDAWDRAIKRLSCDQGERLARGSRARDCATRYTWVERQRRALAGLEASGEP